MTGCLATAAGFLLGAVALAVGGGVWLYREGAMSNFESWQDGVAQGEVLVGALERWRLEHGTFPAQLDELVPEEMPAIPGPIVGEPVWRYARSPDGRGYRLRFASPSGYPSCTRYERFCGSPRADCDPALLREAEALLPEAIEWRAAQIGTRVEPQAFGPGAAWTISADHPSGVGLVRDGTVVLQGWVLHK